MLTLFADIGGSHARYCFVKQGKLGKIFSLNCDDYANPIDLLSNIIQTSSEKITQMFIAVAGPMQKGKVQWTNRPSWSLNELELKKYFHLKKVALYNDLYAQGVGVKLSPKKTALLMNIGTGFGSSIIQKGQVIPCEFGLTLDEHNKKKETYLSAQGIIRMYHELGGDRKISSAKEIDFKRTQHDKIAIKTYQQFYTLWGKTAGNITTALMYFDTVLLWGGLIPHTPKDFQTFMRAFHHKSYPKYQQKISVKLVKGSSLTFKGLQHLSKI